MVLSLSDLDPTIDNNDRLDVMVSYAPSGASWKNFMHYAQLINDR